MFPPPNLIIEVGLIYICASSETYTPFTLGSRTVPRVDVNIDGSVSKQSILPRTGPPRGGSLHRSITVPVASVNGSAQHGIVMSVCVELRMCHFALLSFSIETRGHYVRTSETNN